MRIKVKKIHPNAIMPSYAKAGDAGLDLVAVRVINQDLFQITYGTGLAFEIPLGFVGLVFPRSSIRNQSLTLSNSVGVIDSGFRGEIQLTFNKKIEKESDFKQYKLGDRIGQIIIIPYPQIDVEESVSLSETERGEDGFGSSGS